MAVETLTILLPNDDDEEDRSDLKCIEAKINNLIHQKEFCGLCFEADVELWMVDMEFEVTTTGDPINKTLMEILADVFHEITYVPASNYVCKDCTEKTIQSYIFIHNTVESAKVIDSYINSFYSKVYSLNEQVEPGGNYSEFKFVIILEPDTVFPTDDKAKLTNLHKDSQTNYKETTVKEELMMKTNLESPTKTKVAEIKVATVKTEAKKENFFIIEPIKLPKEVDVSSDDEARESIKVLRRTKTKVKKANEVDKNQNLDQSGLGYRCLVCNLQMPSFRLWKEHRSSCNNIVTEECKICQKKFSCKKFLISHYNTHNMAQCKLCNTILVDTDLSEHLKRNHFNESYSCDKCESAFYSSMAWKAHLKLEHSIVTPSSDGSSQCLMCFKFIQEDQMANHLCRYKCSDCEEMPCIHHKYLLHYKKQLLSHVKKIKCLDCDYVCRQKGNLIGHVNKEHLNYQPFKCDICSTQYYSKHSYNTHLSNHKKDIFVCKYCDEHIKEEEEYLEHMKLCSEIKRQFECSRCEASFSVIEKLSSHINTKHTTKFSCDICNKKYVNEVKYLDHINFAHDSDTENPNSATRSRDKETNSAKQLHQESLSTSVQPYKCEQCYAEFNDENVFIEHGCEIITYICDQCGVTFYSRARLAHHLKSHKKASICKICQKLIKPNSMHAHMQTHNSGLVERVKTKRLNTYVYRKHKCVFCDHVTFTKGMLEAHTNRYHLKVKPYKCDQCDVSYPSKYQLTEHKVVHDAKKWLKCKTCSKVFLRSTSLKRHMMLHTGEKPHTCDICGEGFKSISTMKEHRLKHLDRTVSCPICKIMFYTIREVRAHIIKVHWKDKDQKFDPRKLPELDKKDYFIFRDARKVNMSDSE